MYLLEIAGRSLAVYLSILLMLRIGGRRELGQLTPFDLVVILLVANSVQNAMVGSDVSLEGGLVSAGVIFFANAVVARLRIRAPWFEKLVEGGGPVVLVQNGRWNDADLAREGLQKEDVLRALREHGEVADVSQVALAVLETDGSVSTVPITADVVTSVQKVKTRHRRRLRHRKTG
jgi:uncharacterized membrane protein YcaP (DUF421 family)